MPYIAWNEQYELGIGQLDDHHRKLVELFNSTYRCCLEGNPESVVDNVVKELDNYVVYHFSAEERLMKAHDYPNPTHTHGKAQNLYPSGDTVQADPAWLQGDVGHGNGAFFGHVADRSHP